MIFEWFPINYCNRRLPIAMKVCNARTAGRPACRQNASVTLCHAPFVTSNECHSELALCHEAYCNASTFLGIWHTQAASGAAGDLFPHSRAAGAIFFKNRRSSPSYAQKRCYLPLSVSKRGTKIDLEISEESGFLWRNSFVFCQTAFSKVRS